MDGQNIILVVRCLNADHEAFEIYNINTKKIYGHVKRERERVKKNVSPSTGHLVLVSCFVVASRRCFGLGLVVCSRPPNDRSPLLIVTGTENHLHCAIPSLTTH